MDPITLASRLGSLKSQFQDELKRLILDAAKAVQSIKSSVESVIIKLEDDVEAVVDTKRGSITVGGTGVDDVATLTSVAEKLHPVLTNAPNEAAAAGAPVQAASNPQLGTSVEKPLDERPPQVGKPLGSPPETLSSK